MTVWSHLPTIFNRRRALRTAGILTLCVALTTTLFLAHASRVEAVPNVTRTISFQGRLLTSAGSVVPDGHYNFQFKIYQGGTGTAAGNPGGTLKWTESYVNNGGTSGVDVKNGYWAIDLGSNNPFGTSVDWDQATLWISMNIGGVASSCTTFGSGACTADGEMLPMKKISATPYALNAGSLGGIAASGFLQNSTSPQTADFNVTGNGTVGGVLNASNIDTASAGALQIGTTNATSINLNEDVAVAPGKSLTIAGGSTGTRPSSPTEGMVYFDTTTKQLLVYANGKWQSDRSTSTKVVAASNSNQSVKDAADYVATGTGDQTVINAALTAAAGGKVYLAEGTFTVNASISIPNNTVLSGAGIGTIITIPNSLNGTLSMITNTDATTGIGVTVRDLTVDGNKAGQTAGVTDGISFVHMGDTATSRSGGLVTGVTMRNVYGGSGLSLSFSSNNIISNNTVTDNSNRGIYLSSSARNSITGNNIKNNSSDGIYLTFSTANTMTGNNIVASGRYGLYISDTGTNNASDNVFSYNSTSIVLNATTYNTLNGNVVSNSNLRGIYLSASANSNVINANNLVNNGGTTNNDSIYLAASDLNTITNNTINDDTHTTSNYSISLSNNTSDNNYLSGNSLGGGTIQNNGTGTVFGGQIDGSSNYVVQPAGSIKLQGNTDVTGAISGTSSLTLGTSSSANGTIVFNNSTNANKVTVVSGAQTGNYTLTIPVLTANDTLCTVGLANCGGGGGAKVSLQGSTPGTADTGSINVSGTIIAGTQVITPGIDAATASTLSIGSSNATSINLGANVQIGTGTGSGQPKLLRLDIASTTPTASGAGIIGSMYYDTSAKAVKCYNSDGWGKCSSSPDSFVTFSPEFAGAVLQGTGDGTMTAGLCSDTLHINDGTSSQPTICGTNETYNFYKWTTPTTTTAQTYSIFVTYQLPSTFTSFVAGSTSLMGRTDSTNSSVTYDVYKKSSSGLIACGTTVSVSTGAQTSWQTGTASGTSDPSTCGFAAGNSILIKANVSAKSSANAYVGTLNFAFSNK